MFTTLVLVIFLSPLCFAEKDASSLAKTCILDWLDSKPSGSLSYDQVHCYRLELLIKCLSAPTTGSSRLLDDFRFMVEQEAIFAEKYAICPKIRSEEFEKITKLVRESGISRHYRYDQIDDDQWSACAKQVHTTCNDEYIDVFQNHRLCKDFSSFVACLQAEKNKINCQSRLIKNMIDMYDEAGNDFVQQIRKILGPECPK